MKEDIKKLLTVRTVTLNGQKSPGIMIAGKWLNDLGWKKGIYYSMQAGEKKIIIERE